MDTTFLAPSLIFVLVPVILGFFSTYLKKTHVSKYDSEFLNRVRNTPYPNYYKYIYGIAGTIIFLLFVSVFISSIFLPMLLVDAIKNILAPTSVYFMTWGILALSFVNLPGVGLILLSINYNLTRMLPESFRNYTIKIEVEHKNSYKDSAVGKRLAFLAFVWYLLAIPILFISFHYYNAVFKNKVIANELFSIKNREYSFSEIQSVNYSTRPARGNPPINIDVFFNFTDGRKVNFYNSFLNPHADKELKAAYKVLKSNNVPLYNFPEEITK